MAAALLDTLPLSRRQVDYVVNSTSMVNLAEGAIRSGKTAASLLRWLIYVADAPTGGALVMVGRTRDSLARNVFGPLQDRGLFGDLARHVHYTPGAASGTILGRTVHVFGASDAKAEPVIRGLTVAGAYVDELTVVSRDFFRQLLGRMSVEGAQLFATTNPDTPTHWVRRDYLDRLDELPEWRTWRFTLDDNPSLSSRMRERYRRMYTGLWYRRYILGEWVAAEGAVYEAWDPARHVVDDLPPITRWLGAGVDYGTTNPFVALLLGLGEDGRLYLAREWRHDSQRERRQLTDPEYSAALRGWLSSLADELDARPEWVFVDPSAASFSLQLYRDGMTNVAHAINDVLPGIRTVAGLLARDRLRVHRSCTGWITEVPGYSWDDTATARGEDKPVKMADHSLDAGRYVIHSTAHVWAPLLGEEVAI